MGFEIQKQDGIFEVCVSGRTSKHEILCAIAELVRRDPGKRHPDLWTVAAGVQVPYPHYAEIAEAIGRVFAQPPISRKSAIVASDDFQKAQLELYRLEASMLPLDIRIFRSRDEAVAWLKSPEPDT